jgi:transposase
VLCGILFVLYTGIRWEFLPQELGFGSGMTCWRRLRDWNEAGVWKKLHELLLSELRAADLLDFSRAAVDSSHIRAMKGGPATGPSPVGRGKTGSKHHVIVDAHGIPLATITTGGNRNDVTQLIPLIEAIPPIRGKRGQPLRRPKHLYADRGYDHETYRDQVRRFEITPHIARRASNTAPVWASTAGSWKGRSRCCTGSAACASAGRSGTTSTTRSSPWAAPSSAGDDSAITRFVRGPYCAARWSRLWAVARSATTSAAGRCLVSVAAPWPA